MYKLKRTSHEPQAPFDRVGHGSAHPCVVCWCVHEEWVGHEGYVHREVSRRYIHCSTDINLQAGRLAGRNCGDGATASSKGTLLQRTGNAVVLPPSTLTTARHYHGGRNKRHRHWHTYRTGGAALRSNLQILVHVNLCTRTSSVRTDAA